MITTREAVLAALFVRVQAAAAAMVPAAGAVRNPTEPADLVKGGAEFALLDGEPGEPEPEVNNDPPFYVEHVAEIEIIIAASEADKEAAMNTALGFLDSALDGDADLGGLVKGQMRWTLSDLTPEAVAGASPNMIAAVAVTMEYETATRLGV